MEERVTVRGLAAAAVCLIAPADTGHQGGATYFCPAGQAVIADRCSSPIPSAWRRSIVGLGNFEFLLSDPYYRASFVPPRPIFSTLVTLTSMILRRSSWRSSPTGLLKGSGASPAPFSISPYAVAPAIAGVLWLSVFRAPASAWCSWYLGALRLRLEPRPRRRRGDGPASSSRPPRAGSATTSCSSSPPSRPSQESVIEAAAVDGARFCAAVLDDRAAAAVAHHVLPARGRSRLCLLRSLSA